MFYLKVGGGGRWFGHVCGVVMVALIQRRRTSAETKCCLISVTPLRRQEGLCAALNTQASSLLRFIQRQSCEERWRFVLGANGFDGKSEMRGGARKPCVQTGFEKNNLFAGHMDVVTF